MNIHAVTRRTQEVQLQLARIWSNVLSMSLEEVDLDANFFTLGADSMLVIQVAEQVASQFFADRPDEAPGIAEYFSYGTIRALANRIVSIVSNSVPAIGASFDSNDASIAIIGMACRFPDATDTQTFWRNLCDGTESIRKFSDDDLLAAGVKDCDLRHPGYVKYGVLLSGIRVFDAEYFGMTPREAVLTSPEQRLLLECAEEALQDSGYGDRDRRADIGVFVGSGLNTYFLELLATEAADPESSRGMALMASNTCAASRISYLLDLAGPSFTVDTACSSSLVAVHAACQSLRRRECSSALAGGATVRRFAPRGYLPEPEGIFSVDGHCRPFDQSANGTVSSSGAGIVLLKRLSDAIAEGDFIYAVIRGTAINNDGGTKAGYTAPSALGQAEVIRAALVSARVAPETIHYLETHGTGTSVGDSIEISALRDVFGSTERRAHPLALGTLKANVGHMEAAAGIGGLMKTALVLRHRLIPPAIHFREWASALGEPSFLLSSRLEKLLPCAVPLRAGVSSFGIGGTNAHAILEEAPSAVHTDATTRRAQLLVISARTETALRDASGRVATRLKTNPSMRLSDVAYTLQVGRRAFGYRTYVVASTTTEAAEGLELARSGTPACAVGNAPVIFMFPGRGVPFAHALHRLFDIEPEFREYLNGCRRSAEPLIGGDLLELLTASTFDGEPSGCYQAALFAFEYSLGQLWRSWGVEPTMMVTSGVGEYVAACISGLFTLRDALRLVVAREMRQELNRELRSVEWGEISIPWIGGGGLCAGSPVMARPEYWESRVREEEPSEGVRQLMESSPGILLEIGIGTTFSELMRKGQPSESFTLVSSMDCNGMRCDEHTALMDAVGRLWASGVTVDWRRFNAPFSLKRVPLPTYPFERREHWRKSPTSVHASERQNGRAPELSEWFNNALWEQSPPLKMVACEPISSNPGGECCVVFGTESVLESAICERLLSLGMRVVRVSIEHGSSSGTKFSMRPGEPASLVRLFEELERAGTPVTSILHCGEAEGDVDLVASPDNESLEFGLYSVLDLCAALSSLRRRPRKLAVITRGAYRIATERVCSPRRAMLPVAVEVVAKEFPDIRCRTIDCDPDVKQGDSSWAVTLNALINEIMTTSPERVIAIRGVRRWARTYRPAPLQAVDGEPSLLRAGGTYLITGGMGGIGWTLAHFLARELHARLLLVGRSSFPSHTEWPRLLARHTVDETIRMRIREIQSLESAGARVLVAEGDVSCIKDMQRVVRLGIREFGGLDGVIHAAGIAGAGALHQKSRESISRVLAPKVMGTWVTHEACKTQDLDFFVCCSSIASVIAPAGWYEYCAANAFQDAFCEAHDGTTATRFLSINWDRWSGIGMAANLPSSRSGYGDRALDPRSAISPEQGVEVFKRVMSNPSSRWVISTSHLEPHQFGNLVAGAPSRLNSGDNRSAHGGGNAPVIGDAGTMIEARLGAIWKDLLGIESVQTSDDFFELGGDSLLALDLHTRMEAQFGRVPAVRDLISAPTLGAMVQLLRETP